MNKAVFVFLHEFRTNFRRRSYLITTFVIPLIVAGAVYVVTNLAGGALEAGGGVEGVLEGIAGSESAAATDVVGLIDLSGMFTAPAPTSRQAGRIIVYTDEAEAQAALDAGDVRAYYVVGPNYLADGTVTRYAKQFDLIRSLSDMSMMTNFLTEQLLGDTEPTVYFRLVNPANFSTFTISTVEAEGEAVGAQEQPARDEAVAFILPYVFGILLMIGMMFASGYLMVSVTREKESRTIEILLSSAKPFALLVGKVLSAGALGLLSLGVYLFVFWLVAPQLGTLITSLVGLFVPTELIALGLIYFVGGFLLVGGFYAGVGAVAARNQDAQQVAGWLVIPFVIPLAFINEFAANPNNAFPVFLSMFPLTSPMAMVMRASATDVPLAEIVISLALLALGAVGSIWFAARLFRVNVLLAGQPPKLRDLVRLVREG